MGATKARKPHASTIDPLADFRKRFLGAVRIGSARTAGRAVDHAPEPLDGAVERVPRRCSRGLRRALPARTLANSVTHLPPTAAQLPGLVGGVYSIHPSHADLPGRTRPQGRATATGDCNGQC